MSHSEHTSRIAPADQVVLSAIGLTALGAVAYAGVYGSVGLVITLAIVLVGLSTAAALAGGGRALSQWAMPVLGMATVGLLIHAARGHNEAHFAVFAFMACLVVYRKVVPVVVGAAAIAVHHLSFNYMQAWGWGPICFTEPGLMKVVEHAVYVVAEAAVLIFLALRAQRDFQAGEEITLAVERMMSDDGRVDLQAARMQAESKAGQRLQDALAHITEAMQEVHRAAEAIRQASSTIQQGNSDLQMRTEQAASSIQETAAAVEEIAGTIKSSAESARQANGVALKASEVATEGGDAVNRVVDTMSGIQNSSRKITDIIGVIDGIAFQTNILALNAAVEAARAGEQGRGFAVVAGEVRTLAQRSAEAAREIKQLITDSVEQVDTGSQLVGSTGETIGQVVQQVRQVTDLISHISTSSSEQNDGIGQINQAINRLDATTQQNAALVEQTSAVAHGLQQMSDELHHAVSQFRLPDLAMR
ncbi:chemotaxis protein [Aquabacterium lacunae]|uniref:Chemotaxis protein n=1 Tax=Aquabacterium lacunae TaxID=2528630 RepID=A0A4Q9H292_9BURK|nr:methyl-accepting chemotaxis protein [Aquabacterium lacunae]TBO34192.1 chemotaxis protein [Aquabacterium lacunae]